MSMVDNYKEDVLIYAQFTRENDLKAMRGHLLQQEMKNCSIRSWIKSRAVSLQRYTCSSDDILQYATKVLKAELPVSIRLIGLRMSQFSKEIRNSDPSQATITKFMVQKNSSRQDLDDNDPFDRC